MRIVAIMLSIVFAVTSVLAIVYAIRHRSDKDGGGNVF